jgi:hypothetical protein
MLEIERRIFQFRVKAINNNEDNTHKWFDQTHTEAFAKPESFDKAERMHTSAEAYVKI